MKKFNFNYVILIFLVAFNLRLGISSVPPIQTIIQESLRLSNFQVSLLVGIPVVCMGIFAFLVSKVQAKFGRQKSILWLLILLGISTIGRLFVTGYVFLLVTTFCIGFAIAIIGPLLSGFIKEEFSEYSSILVGVYSFAMGVGSLIVSSFTKAITISINWKFGLGIWGILTIIAAVIWQIFSPKEEHSIIEEENQEKIVLNDFNIWKMIIFFSVQSGIFYGISTWLVPFLENKNVDKSQVIMLLTVFVAAQMLFGFVIPLVMHKIGSIRKWTITSSLCLVIGCIIPLVIPVNILSTIVFIMLMSIGLGGSFPIAMILPLKYAKTANEASVVTSVVQAFGYIIGGIIPVFFGYIVDSTKNFNNLFVQMAVGSVILLMIGMSKFTHKK